MDELLTQAAARHPTVTKDAFIAIVIYAATQEPESAQAVHDWAEYCFHDWAVCSIDQIATILVSEADLISSFDTWKDDECDLHYMLSFDGYYRIYVGGISTYWNAKTNDFTSIGGMAPWGEKKEEEYQIQRSYTPPSP